MNATPLQKKMVNATKWSVITEIAAKLVSPVTSMVLARIIAPEAFGVVATVTMITSFADMFTDAGFQKYLVQHDFKTKEEKEKNANVAFLTNFLISIFFWLTIIIFSDKIAFLVGSPGLGNVVAVACVQLPLTAFSSIQMALYRREFDFKTLFIVRMISIFVPFFVTIPLAFLGYSYWALIIGTICMQVSNALILTFKSKWKPNFFYKFRILKEMLSFSIWSLIEAISIWLTIWIDIFIIGSLLSEYDLGIYKTSTSMVNSIMSLITAATVPVLFSALSRLQNDRDLFKQTFFNMQKIVSVFVFPLGVGVWLFSDLVTKILLGSGWDEASKVIGIWALTSAIMIVFGNYCSEVYRAKGKPKLSFIAQISHLIVLIPACIISSKYGFWVLVYTRSWIRLEFVLVHFILMKFVMGISVLKTIKNITIPAISSIVMGLVGYFLQKVSTGFHDLIWNFISIVICVILYIGILYLFPSMRLELVTIVKKILKKER